MSLDCPHPDCDEIFHTYHDEHAMTSLVYHMESNHPALYSDLKKAMGGSPIASFEESDTDG